MEPVLIGALILDVHAKPATTPISGTTVPGQVLFTPGGVARNVAECIFKLGIRPFMIGTLGLDGPANVLLKEWKLSMEGILRREDITTPIVSLVYDINGEVSAGVAGVDAVEKFLTPEWIQRFEYNISSAPLLMLDANLSTLGLEASCKLAAEFNVPVWFEPVSVTKSRRITSIAKYVTIVSPNQDELIAMANALCAKNLFHPFKSEETKLSPEDIFRALKPAIWILLENGIKVVIVTLGSNGALLCSKGNPKKAVNITRKLPKSGKIFKRVQFLCSVNRFSEVGLSHSPSLFAMHFPTIPAKVKKLTGAGDCLVGGTVASLSDGLDIIQSLAVGIASAKAAVESDDNVPPKFNLDLISDDAELVYNGAKMLLVHQSML
ncbi:Pseudouridine kinase [Cardamine amara subsp. amara]|uniref:Pseudouridine kinase n=1 Tax=Cardamine amara subsp. amara TaxID=228776 RepID=A0ABD1B5F6_CARAN